MLNSLRALLVVGLLAIGVPITQSATAQAPAPAPAGEARPPKIPALNFARDSGISRMTLSPDGNKLALRVVNGTAVYIAIADPATQKATSRINLPAAATFEWLRWAGNEKLLIALSAQTLFFGEDARVSRLYLFDIATQKLSLIGRKEMGLDGDDLLYVDPAGDYVLLSMQRTIYDYPSVWRFKLDGLAPKGSTEVEREKSGVWDWYTDGSGTVRMGFEPVGRGEKLKIWYRSKPGDPLKLIAKLTEDNVDDQLLDVARIVSGSDEGLVLRPSADGRLALTKFNYATRTAQNALTFFGSHCGGGGPACSHGGRVRSGPTLTVRPIPPRAAATAHAAACLGTINQLGTLKLHLPRPIHGVWRAHFKGSTLGQIPHAFTQIGLQPGAA